MCFLAVGKSKRIGGIEVLPNRVMGVFFPFLLYRLSPSQLS